MNKLQLEKRLGLIFRIQSIDKSGVQLDLNALFINHHESSLKLIMAIKLNYFANNNHHGIPFHHYRQSRNLPYPCYIL